MLAYIRPRGKRSPHAGGTSLPSFDSTAVVTQMCWFELEFVALVCFISQRVTNDRHSGGRVDAQNERPPPTVRVWESGSAPSGEGVAACAACASSEPAVF